MKKGYSTIIAIILALGMFLPYAGCQQGEAPAPAIPSAPAAILTLPPTTAPPLVASPSPSPVPPKPSPTAAPTARPTIPAVTLTPRPKTPGVYENTDYGFIIHYPPVYDLKETGQRSPIVRINPLNTYPLYQVDVNAAEQVMTAASYGQNFLDQLKAGMADFSVVSRKDVMVGAVSAWESVFTWTSSGATLKAKMIFIMRGTQAFQVYAMAPLADYDRNAEILDDILYTFELEEPRPFGVARSQALTVFDASPTTIDPAISRESGSHAYVVEVFSGLVALDAKLNVVPGIADRWDVTGGGTVYTFHLNRKAAFHDGRGVTALDVKYSWERAANPKTKSPTVETYLGDVVGVADMLAGKAREIVGVKVVDDYTLQVTIDAPKAYFLSKLTYPVAFVVDKGNVESGQEWWRQPNGTGPFKVAQWKRDELLILARNDQFYREPASVPYVVVRLFGGVPMIMYQTGEIDVALVGTSDIDAVRDAANPLAKELRMFNVLSVNYVAFSIDKPPFDDVKVRQAFNYAVDKDKIIKSVLKGMNPKARGILPPGMPGFNPGLKTLDFDVAKAKELLAASKYGSAANLPPVTLTIAGSAGAIPDFVAAVIAEWKQNLGVQVSVRQLNPETFSYIIKEERDEMTIGGWVADYPDPENFLDVLFHTGSQANDSGYSNPELDALMDKARVEQDPAVRLKMYQDLEQKLIDDAATVPLWNESQWWLVKPYVQDYPISPLGYPLLEAALLLPR